MDCSSLRFLLFDSANNLLSDSGRMVNVILCSLGVPVAHEQLRLLTTFDSALVFDILYYYLVTNFANPLAMEGIVWCVQPCIFRQDLKDSLGVSL